MFCHVAVLCCLGLLLTNSLAPAADAKKALDELEGEWAIVEFVSDGAKSPDELLRDFTLVFAKDKVSVGSVSASRTSVVNLEGTLSLDPSKEPNGVDFIPAAGVFKGEVHSGIYALEGDTLRLCLPTRPLRERPSTFRSADGSNLILCTLKRVKTLTAFRTLAAGEGVVRVAFCSDGKTLATGSGDELTLWEIDSGKARTRFVGRGVALGFSPDGNTLATASGLYALDRRSPTDEIRLWSVATGEPTAVCKADAGVVWAVAFSQDGKTLASSHQDGAVRLWDVATGNNTATLKDPSTPQLDFHSSFLLFRSSSLTFSPDGKTLASGGGPVVNRTKGRITGEIRLWDVTKSKLTRVLAAHEGEGCFANMFAFTTTLAFSPDGKILASGGSRTVELLDVATGTNIATVRGEQLVLAVAFAPDGKTVAVGSVSLFFGARDGNEKALRGEIRLLDVATGRVTAIVKDRPGGLWSLAFRPDGRVLASVELGRTVTLWELFAAEHKAR